MALVNANGIQLAYESYGNDTDPAVILIMGLGQQLTAWPESLPQLLVDRGFRVVLFDNRDCGLSSDFNHAGVPDMSRILLSWGTGLSIQLPYRLLDMVADVSELITALGLSSAHVVGASMGGMIAQLLAILHPEQVSSLTSIMSTTGNRFAGRPTLEATKALFLPQAAANDLEAICARAIRVRQAFAGSGFPVDEDEIREKTVRATYRSFRPHGTRRQLAASLGSGDRRRWLRKLRLPVSVIHGEDDPLIPLQAGIDTRNTIRDAELVVIPGMGHEFPDSVMPVFADTVMRTASRCR